MKERCGATFEAELDIFHCHLPYQHEGHHKCEWDDEASLTWKNDNRKGCECGHRERDHAHYSAGEKVNNRCIYCGCPHYRPDRRPVRVPDVGR